MKYFRRVCKSNQIAEGKCRDLREKTEGELLQLFTRQRTGGESRHVFTFILLI